MIIIRKSILIGFIMVLCQISNAQIINTYGIKIGIGSAKQRFEGNTDFWKDSYMTEKRVGFIGQIIAEKYFNRYFSLRPALGYVQKGYEDDIRVMTGDDRPYWVKQNVTLHNLSLDLSLKVTPINKKIKAYILFGFRGDYLLEANNEMTGYTYGNYISTYFDEGFTKFNIGPVIGVGFLYNDLICLELEYNPSIFNTAEYSTDYYDSSIKGKYFSLNIGLNLNILISSKDE